MGGKCGTNETAVRIGVSWQDLKARDGLDGRIILQYVLKKESAQTGIVLVVDRERWRAIVSTVMNLRLP